MCVIHRIAKDGGVIHRATRIAKMRVRIVYQNSTCDSWQKHAWDLPPLWCQQACPILLHKIVTFFCTIIIHWQNVQTAHNSCAKILQPKPHRSTQIAYNLEMEFRRQKGKKREVNDNIPEVQTTVFWVVRNPSSLGTGFLAKSIEGNTAAAGIMSFFCFLSIWNTTDDEIPIIFVSRNHQFLEQRTDRERDRDIGNRNNSIFFFFSLASLKTPKSSLKAVALKLLKRDDESGPPSWVAAMASGIVQSVSFTQNRKLARYVKSELHEKTIEQASFSDKCNNKLRRVSGFRV